MALASFRWRRFLRTSISTIIGCGCIGAVGTMGLSALLNWDPSGDPATPGGTGTWNYTSSQWDDDGSLPNVRWSDLTGLDTAAFGGTGNLVHLGTAMTANGLTFNATGYTIDTNGSAANTLSLVTSAAAGLVPVIANNAANVTATISASILGNDGLQFTAGAFTGTTTKLSGDNKFIGGVTLTSGTVSVENAGALNQSIRNTLSFGTAASALLLNGNSVTVRDLSGTTNLSGISNGAASTNAILTVYQLTNKTVNTVLSDGTAGTLELVKAGPGVLTLGSDHSYTGATTVRGGTLELAGNNAGRLTATTAINLSDGAALRLTNGSGVNNGSRIPDGVPLNLRGGTFAFANNATASDFAETAGQVNVLAGTGNLFADRAAVGQTSVLVFSSLVRSQGAVVTFQSQFAGATAAGVIGLNDNRDRVVFTAAPALNDGIIGGWALFDTSDFATYNTTTVTSVKMAAYVLNQDQSLWTTATNVKVDQSGTIALSDPALTGVRTVNSLNFATDNVSLNLNGLTLNIDTGGLIHQTIGAFGSTIGNGSMTAGTAAGADLVITIPDSSGTLTFASNAAIINNGVGQVNAVGLIKSGPGTVILSGPSFYTGPTAIVGGTLQIDFDNALGSGSGATTLKLYDGTLGVATSMTLDPRRTIEVGGNSIISVAAGATGAGQVFTFNGAITSLAGTEGSLTFRSNASALSTEADPGKVVTTLNAALVVGGSLRIDATTATGTSTGVFRMNASSANSIGRSLQIGLNGTAIVTQVGGTLTVGAGVDDTLDVGLKDLNTFSSVPKVGTLSLTVPGTGATTQFTAKVDKIRIGVQMQPTETVANNTTGALTLATNNDISVGTAITISDNANPSGSTLPNSSLVFGGGTSNVTTQTFTVGGRKGSGTASILAAGTLNLKGFGERTLNLSIGRSDSSATNVVSTGNFAATAGTLVGNFDNLILGQKTGSATVGGGAVGTFTVGNTANSLVANNVKLGVHTDYAGSAAAAAAAVATLNFDGGTFTVYNDVALGTQANNGTARGALNVTRGTFNVGGNITKTDSDRSNGVVTVNGATAVLNLRNPLAGDTTSGTITASELIYRLGSITTPPRSPSMAATCRAARSLAR